MFLNNVVKFGKEMLCLDANKLWQNRTSAIGISAKTRR